MRRPLHSVTSLGSFVAPPLLVLTALSADTGSLPGLLSIALSLAVLAQIANRALHGIGFEGAGSERRVAGLAVAIGAATLLVTALGVAGLLRWSTYGIVLAVFGLAAGLSGRGGSPEDPRGPSESFDWRAAAAGTLAIAAAAGCLFDAAHAWRYTPPGGAHYDDVSYHLPAAVVWLQYGDLRMLRFDFGDPSTAFYPIGGEIASWLLLAPLRGDFLARWSQLPAGIGILMLLWALTRRAGGSAWAAAGAVALALSIPRFLPDGLLSAGGDLWSAFWLLATVLFLDRFAARPAHGEAALLGLALGGFVGVKYFSLLCLPALLGIAAVVLPRPAGAPRQPRWSHLATIAAVAFVAGGFAYVRNAVVTGNPFFPQPVEVAGLTVLPGWPEASLARRVEQAAAGSWLGAFGDRPELLGPVWGVLFLAITTLLPAFAGATVWKARDRPSRLLLALALLPGLLLLTYALLAPDLRDVRYVLAAPLALGAALAATVSRARPGVAAVAWTGLLVLAALRSGTLGWTPSHRTGIAAVVAAAIAVALARRGPRTRFVTAACAVLLAPVALAPTLDSYQRQRLRFEPGPRRLSELAAGRPVSLAYFGGNRPYFYYGDRLENRLEIAPFGGEPELRFYDFGRAPEATTFRGDRGRGWLRNLDRLEVEFVVADEDGLGLRQARWLSRPESSFEPEAEGDGYRIWRRRRGASGAR